MQGRFSGKLPGGPGPGPSSSDTILKDLDLDIRLKLPEEWHERYVLPPPPTHPPLLALTFSTKLLHSQPLCPLLSAHLNGWDLAHFRSCPEPTVHSHVDHMRMTAEPHSVAVPQRPDIFPSALRRLTEQLAADCALLEALRVMDYSLLLGVHYCRGLQPTPLTTDRVRL